MTSRRAAIFGWTASLIIHALLAGYVAWRTSTPDLGFEFELPMEVELGLSEAVSVSAGATPIEPPSEAASASQEPGPGAGADAGVPHDSGPPDAGRRRRERDAGPPVVAEGHGTEGEGAGADGEGRGVAFLPAGSQIALRLDVARVRRSPLAADVRQVLAAMPDWRALIEGSGIDPLDDMDRLLVASPNLERSRLVAAGRASSGESSIRGAAERLAGAAGVTPLEWRSVDEVPVADWHDQDETARVVALIGPSHFVIARSEDLPRVIAVARIRAARGDGDEAPEHPADALLSMEEGEGLSLEVEGFRNFARARPGRRSPLEVLPTRLRMGIGELAGERLGIRIGADFDQSEQASAAVAYWNEAREAYARNVITAVLGLSPILSRLELRSEDAQLRASVDLEMGEMRRVLTLVRGFFEDRARARDAQAPSAPPQAPIPEASRGPPRDQEASRPSVPHDPTRTPPPTPPPSPFE